MNLMLPEEVSIHNLIEWEIERNKHPFVVEGLTEEQICKCWDDSALSYSGDEYAGIRSEIEKNLLEQNILNANHSLLDIGCGPGLYDLPFSCHLKSLMCLDSSRAMIKQLKESCINRNIINIQFQITRWEEFDTDQKYDVVFSSLCPALNNPESIMRMEKYSREYCIYISSANHGPSMALEIWKRLGKDCSFRGYDTKYPYTHLKSLGRDASLRYYKNEIEYKQDVSTAIEMQEKFISKYRKLTPEIQKIIKSVVNEHESDGIVTENKTITLGMVIWRV